MSAKIVRSYSVRANSLSVLVLNLLAKAPPRVIQAVKPLQFLLLAGRASSIKHTDGLIKRHERFSFMRKDICIYMFIIMDGNFIECIIGKLAQDQN